MNRLCLMWRTMRVGLVVAYFFGALRVAAAPPIGEKGYTSAISFEKAVSIFNEEAQASPVGRTQPKLTVRELELALHSCSTTVSNLQDGAYETLIEILKKRHLPPDSYIMMYDRAYWHHKDARESEEPAMWVIVVQFGLQEEVKRTVLGGLRLPVRLEYEPKGVGPQKKLIHGTVVPQ